MGSGAAGLEYNMCHSVEKGELHMKLIRHILLVCMVVLAAVCVCRASDFTLGSRKFSKLTIVAYPAASDCRAFVRADATVEHARQYIQDHAGQFVQIIDSDDTPHLSVQVDCMELVNVHHHNETLGYSLSILVQFYRPFYEDVAYVHAAPWSHMQLLFIPGDSFTQMDFNEHLDYALDEFTSRWLNEHHELKRNDNER